MERRWLASLEQPACLVTAKTKTTTTKGMYRQRQGKTRRWARKELCASRETAVACERHGKDKTRRPGQPRWLAQSCNVRSHGKLRAAATNRPVAP